ncbi:MAG TPA: hypothetical protein VFW00_09880 [Rhodocyclaceae bacterium]|nr:hypothetical protein [Rhodocyclaceae bacterium]
MSFMLFLVGCLLVIAGVDWALISSGVSTQHVLMASLIMLGLGVLIAVTRTRSKDLPKNPMM